MSTKSTSFGCSYCMPSSPDAAWQARCTFPRVAELIDESHFHVMVLSCQECAQHFVSVFTETIDWSDGDDPQCWVLLPLTGDESRILLERGSRTTESDLNALGTGRRSLTQDHPKGEKETCFWGTGLRVRWHD